MKPEEMYNEMSQEIHELTYNFCRGIISDDEFVSWLINLWWNGDTLISYFPDTKRLEISTGGWSDNEGVIDMLQDCVVFWSLCWLKSQRGGQYVFSLDLPKESKNA